MPPFSMLSDVEIPETFFTGGNFSDKFPADLAAMESQKAFASRAPGYGESGSSGAPLYDANAADNRNANLAFSDKTIRSGFIR